MQLNILQKLEILFFAEILISFLINIIGISILSINTIGTSILSFEHTKSTNLRVISIFKTYFALDYSP